MLKYFKETFNTKTTDNPISYNLKDVLSWESADFPCVKKSVNRKCI